MENTVKVTNRSRATVGYRIPETGVRRVFTPGETKVLPADEMRALSYQPGGPALISRNLLIEDMTLLNEMAIKTEPEYFWNKDQVIAMLEDNGPQSVDKLIDCLNFAPVGVIDLVKEQAVALPVQDARKRAAIKDLTGYDVDLVLLHNRQAEEEEDEEPEEAPERRVKIDAPARRVQPSPYKIVTPVTTEE